MSDVVPVTLTDIDPLVSAQHVTSEQVSGRVEILDGMLIVNPPASFGHAELTDKLGDLFQAHVPDGLKVNYSGMGIYLRDESTSTYQEPDVTICRLPTGDCLVGAEVEVAAEVVSPANRRLADYEQAVIDRASTYGIEWVLIVDTEAETVRWWRNGAERDAGPVWISTVDIAG